MDRHVVPGGLIAGVVVLTVGLLLSSRRHTAQQVGGEQVLGYGRAWKILVGLLGIIPVALPILAALAPAKEDEWWIPWALFAFFVVLELPMAAEIFKSQLRLSRDGLLRLSPWRKPRFLRWDDVHEVSWKKLAQEVEIRGADGRRIRVSRYFSGLGTLAAELRARLPRNGSARRAADFIERLQRGFARFRWRLDRLGANGEELRTAVFGFIGKHR